MIKVTIGSNVAVFTDKEVDESTVTLRQEVEKYGMDSTGVTFHLDGDVVTEDMWDKTFAENDRYEDCFLTAVVKSDSK